MAPAPEVVAADEPPDGRDLLPGGFIESDHPAVRRLVDRALAGGSASQPPAGGADFVGAHTDPPNQAPSVRFGGISRGHQLLSHDHELPTPRDLAGGSASQPPAGGADVVGAHTDGARAAALFVAVRDGYRYDPYDISRDPDDYRAGAVAGGSQSWCVPKATLLTAAARAAGIPARVGFADVRNHLQSQRLRERMGTDLFLWHGYSALWVGDRWLKASPAFNRELCERFGTRVLEFDGHSDALLHEYDTEGNRHMEYLNHRGVYRDVPLGAIFETFNRHYPDLV